jgi:hypothetical protein
VLFHTSYDFDHLVARLPCRLLRSRRRSLIALLVLANLSPWEVQVPPCLPAHLGRGNAHTALLLARISRQLPSDVAHYWCVHPRAPLRCPTQSSQRPTKGILKPSNQADQTPDTTQDVQTYQNISPNASPDDTDMTANISNATVAEFRTDVHDNQSRKSFGGRRVSFAAHAHVRYVIRAWALIYISLRSAGLAFSTRLTKTQTVLLHQPLPRPRLVLPPRPPMSKMLHHYLLLPELLQINQVHPRRVVSLTGHRHPRDPPALAIGLVLVSLCITTTKSRERSLWKCPQMTFYHLTPSHHFPHV